MSGTINLALSQQFDMDGEPLGGGLLYFFAAGTTTPQSAFQDQLLTILHPNPIVLDASGRVPMFYLGDGNIKIRLTDDTGVTVIAADNLLVIGPSSGGGGGGGVDPNTVLQTGDIKARFDTDPQPGFLMCDGRTMGNATSGATYAAAANQALFEFLWSKNVLQVFAGATPSRGATANADWIANKNIVLPDLRGRTIAGMDNMGTVAANRLTSAFFGTSAIVLGAAGGAESKTLTFAQMPLHAHTGQATGITGTENQAHTHGVTVFGGTDGAFTGIQATVPFGLTGPAGTAGTVASSGLTSVTISDPSHVHNVSASGTSGTESSNHNHNFASSTFTTSTAGSGSAHSTMDPTMVMTFYIKL